MKFSLLIAHYNHFEYFQECYQSILAQTYDDFEIILVDDCSTDDSFKNLQELVTGDDKVKLFQNDENKGVGFTKRKCVEMATGTVCAFVDPDDALYADAIELSLDQYKKNKNTIATYSQIMLCNKNLIKLTVYQKTVKIQNGNKMFFNINNEVSHFFTFKRNIYNQTKGINEDLRTAEDFDLYLKIYEKGGLKFIDKPLYLYRQHSAGVSQNKDKVIKAGVHKNWNTVLYNACLRRGIKEIDGVTISQDTNLTEILFKRENTIPKRILRKTKRFLNI